jgi:putative endonuclease
MATGIIGGIWLGVERRSLLGMHALAERLGRGPKLAEHLSTGLRGELEALFHLRRQGFRVVARRWRTPELRGDLDLVGWENGTLCFVEVKTRTARGRLAAEDAVDREKKAMLRDMARAYLRRISREKRDAIPVRFDVLSVYLIEGEPQFEVFRDAFGWR